MSDFDGTIPELSGNVTVPSYSTSMPLKGGTNGEGQLNAQAVAIVKRLNYLQSKIGDLAISVKDFGAVGNGVTDDTAAIQAAITAASGKSLYFQSGTYVITAPLVVTGSDGDNNAGSIRIYGQSKTSTTIKKTNNASGGVVDAIFIVRGPNSTYGGNVFINDMTLDGATAGVAYGIYHPYQMTQLVYQNLRIKTGTGISFPQDVWQATVSEVHMLCSTKGIEMLASGTSNLFERCFVHGASSVAYEFRGNYSSANSLAADACTGEVYRFFWASGWSCNGLGAESPSATITIHTYNSVVSITGGRMFRNQALDTYAFIYAESGTVLSIDSISLVGGTSIAAAGYFYRTNGTSGVLNFTNIAVEGNQGYSHADTNANMVVTQINVGSAQSANFSKNVNLRSNNSTQFAYHSVGRTGADSVWGVAGTTNDLVNGSSSGDTILNANLPGGKLLLAINGTVVGTFKGNTLNLTLPTTSSGLVSGDLWRNGSVVNII